MTQQPREGSSATEKVSGSIPRPPNAQLLDQIRGEYLDMPGLKLTLPQAQRLWRLRERECEALPGALIDATFLWRSSDGRFARVSELWGIDRHRRMAKTQPEPRCIERRATSHADAQRAVQRSAESAWWSDRFDTSSSVAVDTSRCSSHTSRHRE
jgi:hypothetical protein